MATLAEAFDLAVRLHQEGNLQQAQAIYQQILAHDSRHVPTLQMAGVLAMQAQQPAVAIDFLQRGIALDPNRAMLHATLADVLRATGRLAEAKAEFHRALSLDGNLAVAHHNLGLLHQAENNPAAAIASFASAIRIMPRLAESHNELGNLYREQGQNERALFHFQQAIDSKPDFADAHNDLGNLLQDLGRLDEAIAAFDQAIRLRPTMWAACYNRGNALRAAGRLREAADSYREATKLNPECALAHNNLGTLLQELDDPLGAELAFREAVRAAPLMAEASYNLGVQLHASGDAALAKTLLQQSIDLDARHAPSHYFLGIAYQSLREWDEARRCFRRAIELAPDYSEPHCALGILALNEGTDGRHEEAAEHFDRAVELGPQNAEARCNRGILRMSAGNYAEGCPEYLWFTRSKTYQGHRYRQLVWDGSPLEGRTIRILGDHGLGDTLQFVRYLPWVTQQGAGRVVLAAQKSLHPLLVESGFGEYLDSEAGQQEFDVHTSIMMLPALHYVRERSLGNGQPYLRPQSGLVDTWRRKLEGIEGLKVGICWQGNRAYPWRHWRSVRLAEFAPLAKVDGVSLVNLQHGEARQELSEIDGQFFVHDLGDGLDREGGAFMDTAAVIANLDLVVTTDTSLAHVAAGIGAPVWLVLAAAPEWRWQRQGDTTPWYSSMRLFRQRKLGEWSEAFEQLSAELQRLAAGRQSAPGSAS